MHSRLVKYIDSVARTGSFRRASEQLNISASAIDRQILLYEAEIGLKVFERVSKGVRLTPAGEAVLHHVRETLRNHRVLERRLKDLQGIRSGRVQVATIGGLVDSFLADVIAEFLKTFRHSEIVTIVLPIDVLANFVSEGDLELGLAFDLPQDHRLTTISQISLPIGVVVPSGHELANRQTLHLSDCIGYPMCLPHSSLHTRSLINLAFEDAQVTPEIRLESNSITFLKRAVRDMGGITFLTRVDVFNEIVSGELAFIPLQHLMPRGQNLQFVKRRRGSLDPVQSAFAEKLKMMMASLMDLEVGRAD